MGRVEGKVGRFEGKVALVTGAARGQGRSHAVALASEGADVIALDICKPIASVPYPLATQEDLDETVAEIEKYGRRVQVGQIDVRDMDGLKEFVDRSVGVLGGLDVVCANAGIFALAPIEDITVEEWRDQIDVNLTGVWHTAKAAIPHLRADRRGGVIVITNSTAGFRTRGNLGHYATAKHGLVGLMKTLAVELAPDGIRVNAVHPTAVDTLLIHNERTYKTFLPGSSNPTREDVAPVFAGQNLLPDVPWIAPEDVTNAVLFLASDEARYITGASLPVDAGVSIKG